MSAGWMDSAVSEVLESLKEERSRTRAGLNPDNLLSSGSKIQVGNGCHTRNPESTVTAIGAGFEHIWKMKTFTREYLSLFFFTLKKE